MGARRPHPLGGHPAKWPLRISFAERGLCVISSPVFLLLHKNLFISIVGCLPLTCFLLSSFITLWKQKIQDKSNNNYFISSSYRAYYYKCKLKIKQTLI
jgi:hypothetical protein